MRVTLRPIYTIKLVCLFSEFDYLVLLYVEGEDISQRLNNPICLDDKTDIGYSKNFQPKDIFEASDYIIDRLAIMFDKERKLKK